MFNYKASFEGLRKQHELLKKALANKRAVESRLLATEADRNKLTKELSRSQMLLNQERVERGAAQQKEQRLANHLEQEKQNHEDTQSALHEFMDQPEIRDALEQFQTRQKSLEASVPLSAIQHHQTRQPLASTLEKSGFTPER